MGVLAVALYYSCPRLVHLCELRLASMLKGGGGGGSGGSSGGRRAKRHGNEHEEEGELASVLCA